MLGFQRLDVYQAAIRYLAMSAEIITGLPKGNSGLADQLRRAALSVPLNVAEATGRNSAGDIQRHYAIARGSAMECAALMDAMKVLGLIEESRYVDAIQLLTRVVAMCTKLCR